MVDAIVVGAGIAGLGAALALARRGHRVALYEGDPAAPPADAEGMWAAWRRPGTPQAHHIHGFLARSRSELRDRAPDVLAAMLAVGIAEQDLAARVPGGRYEPGDEELIALRARRPVFEGVLRRAVEAEAGVDLRPGQAVRGLLAETGARRVIGITTRGGEQVRADLVVDASGRRSKVRSWLSEIGAWQPSEETTDSGLMYYNRYFTLRPGVEPPPSSKPTDTRGDLPYLGYAGGQGDNRTFVWNVVVPSWDRELRALHREDAWMAAARRIPALARWVDPAVAEPVGRVESMGQLLCLLRRFVVDDRPVAPGLHVIGDALCHTTPTFGYGASLGLTHGFALADAVDAHPDDPIEQALALDAAIWPEARCAYWYAVAADRARRHGFRGQLVPEDEPYHFAYNLLPFAAAVDPVVFRASTRHQHLVDLPGSLIRDDEVMARARRIVAEMQQSGADLRAPGPSREELLASLPPA